MCWRRDINLIHYIHPYHLYIYLSTFCVSSYVPVWITLQQRFLLFFVLRVYYVDKCALCSVLRRHITSLTTTIFLFVCSFIPYLICVSLCVILNNNNNKKTIGNKYIIVIKATVADWRIICNLLHIKCQCSLKKEKKN